MRLLSSQAVTAALAVIAVATWAPNAKSAVVTYQLTDLGNGGGTNQTFAGTGYVGMYQNSFTNLFGLEQSNFSKTALQADISSLIGNQIVSATLSFSLLDGSNLTQSVTATSFDADGTLGHFWVPPSNLGTQNYTVTGATTNALDVTGLLTSRVQSGESWFGLHLQGSSEYQWTYTFSDADRAQVRLTVEYAAPVPVPPTAVLAVLGFAGMGGLGWARRRKAA
jgi:hypothetical protein